MYVCMCEYRRVQERSGAADFQSKKCIIKTNIDVKFTTCVRHVSCLASVEFGSALDELIFYERGAS